MPRQPPLAVGEIETKEWEINNRSIVFNLDNSIEESNTFLPNHHLRLYPCNLEPCHGKSLFEIGTSYINFPLITCEPVTNFSIRAMHNQHISLRRPSSFNNIPVPALQTSSIPPRSQSPPSSPSPPVFPQMHTMDRPKAAAKQQTGPEHVNTLAVTARARAHWNRSG